MSQQPPPDPTKQPWVDRLGQLGRHRYLAKEQAILFTDGRKIPWAQLYYSRSLTEDTAAGPSGSGKAKAGQQTTSQRTQAGTTLSTFTDSAAGREAKIESGEPAQLTPLDLQNARISARRRIVETRSTGGSASSKYKVQTNRQAAFRSGNVIELLYPEHSGGDSAIEQTGEYAMRVRRFVIIEQRAGCSAAVPITTYNQQGVAKRGVIRQHHVIIYTTVAPPAPTAQEGPVRLPNGDVDTLRPNPIQVIPAHAGTALDPMSRLNLREHFVIDHDVEVHVFGAVSPNSATSLIYQFREVNPTQQLDRSIVGPSTSAESTRQPRNEDQELINITQRMRTLNTQDPARGAPTRSQRPSQRQADDDDDEDDPEVINLALRLRALPSEEHQRAALANLRQHDEEHNRDLYPRVIAYLRRTASVARRRNDAT